MHGNPKIVALGGGTGLSTMLRGLKMYTENITAIVTMADDGGGSGRLREDLGILPPGDIRNCLLALADVEPIMEQLFKYRFQEGILKGQSVGNLLIAALDGIYGNFEEAIRRMSDVLAITGRVLPVTNQDIRMFARLEDGTQILGESRIGKEKLKHRCRIESVCLVPEKVMPAEDVLQSIEEADLIILGPGSLYTSIIPNLLVSGVADAIKKSKAPKIYVCNVMTQPGETDEYTAYEHVQAILKHGGVMDYCIVNTEQADEEILKRYYEDGAAPVFVDEEKFKNTGIRLIRASLLNSSGNLARHDHESLAACIMDFLNNNRKESKECHLHQELKVNF